MHACQDLIDLFRECFFESYNTLLIKGGDEPIYLPAENERPHHELYFARGYFASALHEIAHWLIAGEARRKLVDFGYWYIPDGRTATQQVQFQSVEIKPQALEWILSKAAGAPFFISSDNLGGEGADNEAFKKSVYEQVKTYCEKGLSERASLFRQSLCQFYKTDPSLRINDFSLEML